MILQSLVDYYDRSDEVAPEGWERKRMPFIIEITSEGKFVQLTPMKFGPRATDVPTQLVPMSEIRSGTKSYQKPNLLWDHIGFVIGQTKSDEAKDRATAAKQFEHFRRRIGEVARNSQNTEAVQAVERFYAGDEHLNVPKDPRWKECLAIPGCNMTFRLVGETTLVVHDPSVRALVDTKDTADSTAPMGVCLVTGEFESIVALHPKIANVGDKPTPLAAVNDQSLPALASFGKHQGNNFPVGVTAAFKYAAALNHLLRSNSPQRIQIGDATTVFWAQRSDDDFSESWLAELMSGANPDAHAQQVKGLFESVRIGAFNNTRGDNKFFVLGLVPNSARIALRFWHAAPLRDIAKEITRWFSDLHIIGANDGGDHPGIYKMLSSICLSTRERPQGDIGKLPPLLIGQTFQSAFTGAPLPTLLMQSALIRIRAEQAKKDEKGKPVRHVSATRAAILKAYVNRRRRTQSNYAKEITVSLDKLNTEPAYLWGRMFAAYERMQEKAADRELNRTIRDAYFGSAMSTPLTAYNRLAKLNQIHLRELKRSRPSTGEYFDRLLLEIAGKMTSNPSVAFPAQSTPEQQACFALGYYHQRQDFLPKRDAADGDANASANATTPASETI